MEMMGTFNPFGSSGGGAPGHNGADGVGISSITFVSSSAGGAAGQPNATDTYKIEYTDGNSTTFKVTNGTTGAKGDKGEQGEKGIDGRSIVSITFKNSSLGEEAGIAGATDTYEILFSDNSKTEFIVKNGTALTLDTEMSDNSSNGVENKVIKKYIDETVNEASDLAINDVKLTKITKSIDDLLIPGKIVKTTDETTGKVSTGELFNSAKAATGDNSHAEGKDTQAIGVNSHAEGHATMASGDSSHSEGRSAQATGLYSHAEGAGSIASGVMSHAEGCECKAIGAYSHAEGYMTKSSGSQSHAEGYATEASGPESHAEGYGTKATHSNSHAEGDMTIASGGCSHAEGQGTKSSGTYSHAEGLTTTASGGASHAEGDGTTAKGNASHAEGKGTIAGSANQHVQGKYNIEDTKNKFAFIIGNGTDDKNRSNLLAIGWDGLFYPNNSEVGIDITKTGGTFELYKILETLPDNDAEGKLDRNHIYMVKNEETVNITTKECNYDKYIILSIDEEKNIVWEKITNPSIAIDDVMSDTSENTVKNKVIKKYVDDIVGDIQTILATLTTLS